MSFRLLSSSSVFGTASNRFGCLIHKRSYGRTRTLAAQTIEDTFNADTTENDFPIKSKSSSHGFPRESVSKSQIRSSLRVWGAQNEARTNLAAPQMIEAQGRIRQLPNALFLGQGGQQGDAERSSRTSDDDIFEDDHNKISDMMQPGTLLWFSPFGHAGQYAVYIGNVGIQSLLALENGSWAVDAVGSLRKSAFDHRRIRIPNFLGLEELAQLKKHMPKSNIARPIGTTEAVSEISMRGLMPPEVIETFLAAMNAFRQDVDTYTRLFADQYEDGYSRVASEHEYRLMNMIEFLTEGFDLDWDSITPAGKMAVSQHLAAQDSVTSYTTAEDLSVLIMSKRMRKEFEQVVEWARQYQDTASQAALGRDVTILLSGNPLTAFIDKARRLIVRSRKTRSPTVQGSLGPCLSTSTSDGSTIQKSFTQVEFTDTDRMFIEFIWTVAHRVPTGMLSGPLRLLPVTSLILRAVGAYPDLVLNQTIARLFLKEIGCADPWRPRFTDLALTVPQGKASQKTDDLHHEADAYAKQMGDLMYQRNFDAMDSMAHLRQRWTLPAFAIDPEDSNIHEDAFSIEPAKEIDGGYWIHIHVSHISAWFDPDSIIGRLARNQGGSFAAIDKSIRSDMIPSILSHHFSLKQGSPVLTISTLIAGDGSSVDVKMTAGILDNLVYLPRQTTFDVLGIQLDSPLPGEESVLIVGATKLPEPAVKRTQDVSTVMKHKSILETAVKVLQLRRERRIHELPENVSLPYYNFEISIKADYRELADSTREQKSYHWTGDPGIILTAQHRIHRKTEVRRSSDPVTQTMRLAAESAARWLEARQIPAIFVGTVPVPDNNFDQIANKKSYERFSMPLHMRSSKPVPYLNIHLKSFCNCTSPLRRYIDLVTTWQIDSYLKAESAGTVQPGNPVQNQSILGFTQDQIEEYLRFDAHATDTADHTTRRLRDTYACQALFRAFHFKEATLPVQWEVLIRKPVSLSASLVEQNARASLIPFGLDCEIIPDPAGWARMAQPGQYLPVTITTVDPERLLVLCTASGMANDEQTMHDRIYAVDQRTSTTQH